MSWVEKIETFLIITCGDGKSYFPNWDNPEMSMEFNITEFDFPEVEGTLVSRKKPRGRKFNLSIYFQGEDNLDIARSFELSSKDERPWDVSHPIHGKIKCQPVGLVFDYRGINIAKISGSLFETIEDDNPKIQTDAKDFILQSKQITDDSFAVSFAGDVTPNTTDINSMTSNSNNIYTIGARALSITSEAAEYFNLLNDANSAILEATTDPLIAAQKLNNFISYPPTLLSSSSKQRILNLNEQLDKLNEGVDNILTKAEKKIYEHNTGAIVSSMAVAASNPAPGNYNNRKNVFEIIDLLIAAHQSYLDNLDILQTVDGGNTTSYIPAADPLINLGALMNYTISNLFSIAMGARQERIVYLEEDSNLVVLAHRFYGLKQDDSSINELMANNEFGLNHILQVAKGTPITYFI